MNTETPNKTIGFIGLGRMGLAMVTRLVECGYDVRGTDVDAAARSDAAAVGATVYESIAELAASFTEPGVVWVMVPAQFVDDVLAELQDALPAGTTIIDGGNSDYTESRRRHERMTEVGLLYLDCGTSGGVEGARYGASLMVGGNAATFAPQEHIFQALATTDGYALVGGPGAGHFVKAVHNGIEYGMMGALAEGVALLHQEREDFGLSIENIFKPYKNGSIIESRLLDWLVGGHHKGLLDTVSGEVPVGETEAKMQHLTMLGALPILETALAQRKQTRAEASVTGKYIAIMRHEFGGHAMISPEDEKHLSDG